MSSTGTGIDLSRPLDDVTRAGLAARLLERSVVDGECRVFLGTARNTFGHRAMSVHNYPVHVHRVSYAVHHGPIPEGMVVRHTCDNPPCIEGGHLILGTQLDNVRDMFDRGRIPAARRVMKVGA